MASYAISKSARHFEVYRFKWHGLRGDQWEIIASVQTQQTLDAVMRLLA